MTPGRIPATALAALLLAAAFTGLTPPATAQDTDDGEIVIAILDSGIDPDHIEFTSCAEHPLLAWKDFVGNAQEATDLVGHGTAVASVAVGATVGEAPCTKVIVARVCDEDGCATSDIREAIQWATEQGADVINLSLGVIVPVPSLLFNLESEFAAARQAGALTVVAAGNGFANAGLAPYPSYLGQPSGSPDVLVVGSADEQGNAAVGTSSDPEVTQAGQNVKAAQASTTDGYSRPSGTSFAAPNVAGIAAAVQEAWIAEHGERLSPDDLENFLKWTAEDGSVTTPVQEGWGFVDRFTSLSQVPNGMPDPPTCTPSTGLEELNTCMNIVHDDAANTVRMFW